MAITGGDFSRDKQALEVTFPENTSNTNKEHNVKVSGITDGGNTIQSNNAIVRQTPGCGIGFSSSSLSVPSSGICYNSSLEIITSCIVIDTLRILSYSAGMVSPPFISTVDDRQYLDFCVSPNASTTSRNSEIVVSGTDVYGEPRTGKISIAQSGGSEITIQLTTETPIVEATQTSAILRFSVSGGFISRGEYDDGKPFTDVINKTNNYTYSVEEIPSVGNVTAGTIRIDFNQNTSYTYDKEYVVCVSGLSIFNESVNGSAVGVISNDVIIEHKPRSKSGGLKLVADKGSILYSDTEALFTIQQTEISDIGWCQSLSSDFAFGSISGNRLTVTVGVNDDPINQRTIIAVISGITVTGEVVYAYGEVIQGKASTLVVYDADKTPSTNFVSDIEASSTETSRRFLYQGGNITSIGVDRVTSTSTITEATVFSQSSSVQVKFPQNTSNTDKPFTVVVTGLTVNGNTISATYKFTQKKIGSHTFILSKAGDTGVTSDTVTANIAYYQLDVTSSGIRDIGVSLVSATGNGNVTSPRVGDSIEGEFVFQFSRNYTYGIENVYTIRLSGTTVDTGEAVESNIFTITQGSAEAGSGSILFTNPSVSVPGTATSASPNPYQTDNIIDSTVITLPVEYGTSQPIQSGAVARINQSTKEVMLDFPANTSTTKSNTYTVKLQGTDARGNTIQSSNVLVVTQGKLSRAEVDTYFSDDNYEPLTPVTRNLSLDCSETSVYFIVEASNINFNTTLPIVTCPTLNFLYSTWEVENGVGKIGIRSSFLPNDSGENVTHTIVVSVIGLDGTPVTAQSLTLVHKACASSLKLHTYLKAVDGSDKFSENEIRKMILGKDPSATNRYENYAIPFDTKAATFLIKPEGIIVNTAELIMPSVNVNGEDGFIITTLEDKTNTQEGQPDEWNQSTGTFSSTGYVFTVRTRLEIGTKLWKESRTYIEDGEEIEAEDDTDNGFSYIENNYCGVTENIISSTGTTSGSYVDVTSPTTIRRVSYDMALIKASPTGGRVVFKHESMNGDFLDPFMEIISGERPRTEYDAVEKTFTIFLNELYGTTEPKEIVFRLRSFAGYNIYATNVIRLVQEPNEGDAGTPKIKVFVPTNISPEKQDVYISVGSQYVKKKNLIITGISGDASGVTESLFPVTGDETGIYKPNGHQIYKITVPEATDEMLVFRTTVVGEDRYGNTYEDFVISVQKPPEEHNEPILTLVAKKINNISYTGETVACTAFTQWVTFDTVEVDDEEVTIENISGDDTTGCDVESGRVTFDVVFPEIEDPTPQETDFTNCDSFNLPVTKSGYASSAITHQNIRIVCLNKLTRNVTVTVHGTDCNGNEMTATVELVQGIL